MPLILSTNEDHCNSPASTEAMPASPYKHGLLSTHPYAPSRTSQKVEGAAALGAAPQTGADFGPFGALGALPEVGGHTAGSVSAHRVGAHTPAHVTAVLAVGSAVGVPTPAPVGFVLAAPRVAVASCLALPGLPRPRPLHCHSSKHQQQ